MRMRDKGTCKDCHWSETFNKRPDEPSNMGCTYRNWEGYVKPDDTCTFYSKKSAATREQPVNFLTKSKGVTFVTP